MYPSIKRSAFISRDGVSDLRYGNILEKHFTSMIIGRPDSGKSTLIEDLLTNEDLYF
jgi:tRNA U34 5-carboxymethylaminomethyl modifying GTPase MnmE/TrmE